MQRKSRSKDFAVRIVWHNAESFATKLRDVGWTTLWRNIAMWVVQYDVTETHDVREIDSASHDVTKVCI